MNKKYFPLLLLFLLSASLQIHAQRSLDSKNFADSVDILHYDLTFDIDHQQSNTLFGAAAVRFRLLQHVDSLVLDLQSAVVDSVKYQGAPISFNYQSPRLVLSAADFGVADSHNVTIYYHTGGHVESYGFGGFHMDGTIHYNLGVAFEDRPHNYGRVLFPCRDNFHDKATYSFHITSPAGWTTQCSGILDSACVNPDLSQTSHWTLAQPIPTYLVGVATAAFHLHQFDVQGLYGTYPVTVGFRTEDSTRVAATFDILHEVVPMYERCFGPYRWGRIGYVGTTRGSMEHATNIALVNQCIANHSSVPCQSTTIHELGHAWFGNLVTCATADEMWFNEGGATFTSEVGMEALYGRAYANDFFQTNLDNVLLNAHHTDGDYTALQGQTHENVYGTTTYDKGGLVWHSLRGYLGDSLFYRAISTLFDHNAFGSLSASAIRDSLSLYSGTDLTDFFDFHVFGPGFQDFSIDSVVSQPSGSGYNVTLSMRQRLNHAPAFANANRIPITFIGADNQRLQQLVCFDGAATQQSFSLPFEPVVALVDFNRTFANACTNAELLYTAKGTQEEASTHFRGAVTKLSDTARVFVELHYTDPDLDGNPGIVRTAHHYWKLQGLLPDTLSLRGFFAFGRGDHFDDDLLLSNASLDSLRLLYRPSCDQSWQVIRGTVTGGTSSGSLSYSGTKMGEYTLAVVAEDQLATPLLPETPSALRLYPMPCSDGFSISVPGYSGTMNVQLFDLEGRLAASFTGVAPDEKQSISLPAGLYMVRVVMADGSVMPIQRLVIMNF